MKWFVADVVIEITVEDDARNVVHVNTVLVRASDLEQAYRRSLKLGRSQAWKPYSNPAGRKVSTRLVGLGFLGDVLGPIKHGVELVCFVIFGAPVSVFVDSLDMDLRKSFSRFVLARYAGWHSVEIEPDLLLVQRKRA